MSDKIGWNLDNSYARLPESFYSRLNPTPVSSPELVILNHSLARALGLDPEPWEARTARPCWPETAWRRGPSPWPRPTPATSSGILPCWGTAGPTCWGNKLHPGGAV
jgi:serine/tyrosine/threonine adenylyltransferase